MSEALSYALREARKAMGLTQQQVANLVKVSRAAVGQWENGEEPSTENLLAVCKVLGIEIEAATRGELARTKYRDTHDKSNSGKQYEKIAIGLPIEEALEDISTNTIAVYMAREWNDHDGNIGITEFPLYSVPRVETMPANSQAYALALASSVMHPRLEKDRFIYLLKNEIPTIGDIIVAIKRFPPFREKALPADATRIGPAFIGVLESFTPITVSIRQTNPSKLHTVSTMDIGAMHKVDDATGSVQVPQE